MTVAIFTMVIVIPITVGITRVPTCPTEEGTWITRASDIDCDGTIGMSYHCIKNHKNELLEGCLRKAKIASGKGGCPWVFIESDGSVIFGATNTVCDDQISCPEHNHTEYFTDQLYKYPSCIQSDYTTTSTTIKTTSPTTTKTIGQITVVTQATKPNSETLSETVLYIILCVLMPVPFICIEFWNVKTGKYAVSSKHESESTAQDQNQTSQQRTSELTEDEFWNVKTGKYAVSSKHESESTAQDQNQTSQQRTSELTEDEFCNIEKRNYAVSSKHESESTAHDQNQTSQQRTSELKADGRSNMKERKYTVSDVNEYTPRNENEYGRSNMKERKYTVSDVNEYTPKNEKEYEDWNEGKDIILEPKYEENQSPVTATNLNELGKKKMLQLPEHVNNDKEDNVEPREGESDASSTENSGNSPENRVHFWVKKHGNSPVVLNLLVHSALFAMFYASELSVYAKLFSISLVFLTIILIVLGLVALVLILFYLDLDSSRKFHEIYCKFLHQLFQVLTINCIIKYFVRTIFFAAQGESNDYVASIILFVCIVLFFALQSYFHWKKY